MKIAIFIEPNYKLNNNILYWKKKIKEKIGNQIYLKHPPHMTLFTLNTKRLTDKSILSIKKLVKEHTSFELFIKKPSIFFNDPLTKGQTLHYSLKANGKLKILQKKLLNLCKNLIINRLKKNKLKGLMKANFTKYGYPFYGNSWNPHFSIASINQNKNSEIVKNFLKKNIDIKFTVKKISLWYIKGDKHKKLKSFHLL